jgi:Tol biopolymer transport system component
METGSNVQYANGHLIFLRGTALVAQPFDPGTLTLSRDPVTLADPIMANVIIPRAGAFSVSQTGTVVYIPLLRNAASRLVWMTRDGQQTAVEETPSSNRNLSLSPDGLRAAVVPMGFDGMTDLWLVDLKRGVRSRITHDVRPTMALWSRDGRTLYYSARRGNGMLDLYSRGDYGAGPEQVVFQSDVDKWLTSVSADGRTFIYETQGPGLSWDLFAVTLDPTPRVTALLASPFSERWGVLSPDGQWIAYAANSSGQRDEIYVARYPTGAHRTQVSAKGGTFPRWHPLGRELFFYSGNQIFAAAVTPKPDGMEVTGVTPLFTVVGPEGFARSFFDIAPDGRFLVAVPGTQTLSYRLGLLTNWPAVAGR